MWMFPPDLQLVAVSHPFAGWEWALSLWEIFPNSSLFSPQVFTKYGKCYMFNSGEEGRPLLTTVKGGTGNGLEIMLDIQQDEYLPIWGETGKSFLFLG